MQHIIVPAIERYNLTVGFSLAQLLQYIFASDRKGGSAMFGLSPLTTLMVFGMPIVGIILAIIYGLTFDFSKEEWWTIDKLFEK